MLTSLYWPFLDITWRTYKAGHSHTHPAGGSVNSVFFEGFYNGCLWENMSWSKHKWPIFWHKNNMTQLYVIFELRWNLSSIVRYLWCRVQSGGVGMSRGDGYVQGVGGYVQGLGTHLLLLTPNGGHHTYSRQAGGTHPTGMLSCFKIRLLILLFLVLPVNCSMRCLVQVLPDLGNEASAVTGSFVLDKPNGLQFLPEYIPVLLFTPWCSLFNFILFVWSSEFDLC